MNSFIMLVSCLFLFVSCSANITLSPKGCRDLRFATEKDLARAPKTFDLQHVVWTGGFSRRPTYYSLYRILQKHDIDCQDIEAINYSFKDQWQDVFVGFFPFVSRETLRLQGIYRNP